MHITKIKLLSKNLNIKSELMNAKKSVNNMKNQKKTLFRMKSSRLSAINWRVTLFKSFRKRIRKSVNLDPHFRKRNSRFFVFSNISRKKMWKSEI